MIAFCMVIIILGGHYNEELHICTIHLIWQWTGHIVRTEGRNAFEILIGKATGKRP